MSEGLSIGELINQWCRDPEIRAHVSQFCPASDDVTYGNSIGLNLEQYEDLLPYIGKKTTYYKATAEDTITMLSARNNVNEESAHYSQYFGSATHRPMIVKQAKVLKVFYCGDNGEWTTRDKSVSGWDATFVYRVGKIVKSRNGPGVHMHTSLAAAVMHRAYSFTSRKMVTIDGIEYAKGPVATAIEVPLLHGVVSEMAYRSNGRCLHLWVGNREGPSDMVQFDMYGSSGPSSYTKTAAIWAMYLPSQRKESAPWNEMRDDIVAGLGMSATGCSAVLKTEMFKYAIVAAFYMFDLRTGDGVHYPSDDELAIKAGQGVTSTT